MADKQIDFDRYIPVVLSTFVDKMRAASAGFFRDKFGITVLEWRILAFLTGHSACTAYRIWKGLNADKAAVSRAVRRLEKEDLVRIREVPGARMRTAIDLTCAGRSLYAATVPVVEARHRRLVGQLDEQDLRELICTVRYLESRISVMSDPSLVDSCI